MKYLEGRIFPKINPLFAEDLSLSFFTFSYFEEFCIGERRRNCVLNCPSQTGTVWWWGSDCCWSWSMSAWWRLPWLLILLKPTTIRSDYLIETLLKNSSLQGFLFSDFRSDYLNVIYLYQQEMYRQWKIIFSS